AHNPALGNGQARLQDLSRDVVAEPFDGVFARAVCCESKKVKTRVLTQVFRSIPCPSLRYGSSKGNFQRREIRDWLGEKATPVFIHSLYLLIKQATFLVALGWALRCDGRFTIRLISFAARMSLEFFRTGQLVLATLGLKVSQYQSSGCLRDELRESLRLVSDELLLHHGFECSV